MCRPVCCLWC